MKTTPLKIRKYPLEILKEKTKKDEKEEQLSSEKEIFPSYSRFFPNFKLKREIEERKLF